MGITCSFDRMNSYNLFTRGTSFDLAASSVTHPNPSTIMRLNSFEPSSSPYQPNSINHNGSNTVVTEGQVASSNLGLLSSTVELSSSHKRPFASLSDPPNIKQEVDPSPSQALTSVESNLDAFSADLLNRNNQQVTYLFIHSVVDTLGNKNCM